MEETEKDWVKEPDPERPELYVLSRGPLSFQLTYCFV